jgi:hypothetical protein
VPVSSRKRGLFTGSASQQLSIVCAMRMRTISQIIPITAYAYAEYRYARKAIKLMLSMRTRPFSLYSVIQYKLNLVLRTPSIRGMQFRHWRKICHRYQGHRWLILPPVPLVLLIPVANLPPV